MAVGLCDRARYRLEDGREFIVLSFDYLRNRYRVTWTKPERRDEDVEPKKLEALRPVMIERFTR